MKSDPIVCAVDSQMRIVWVSHGKYVSSEIGKPICDQIKPLFIKDFSLAVSEAMLDRLPVPVYLELLDGSRFVVTVCAASIPGIPVVFASQQIPCLPFDLSRREIEVMLRLKRGMRPGEIQQELDISSSTYAEHQRNAMQKTGTGSPAELATCAALMRLDQYVLRLSSGKI